MIFIQLFNEIIAIQSILSYGLYYTGPELLFNHGYRDNLLLIVVEQLKQLLLQENMLTRRRMVLGSQYRLTQHLNLASV